jgi:glycosyltransferase involved in cell wall biosynthesis
MIDMVVTYYNSPHMLGKQMEAWRSYSPYTQKNIRIIVVDDGSQTEPASKVIAPVGFPLALAVISQDIGWNNGGARNVGATIASASWLFLVDIDHVLEKDEAQKLVGQNLNSKCYYNVSRTLVNKTVLRRPENIIVVPRSSFWDVGGYDEDFSGHYGYEDAWFRYWLQKLVEVRSLPVNLVCFMNKDIKDAVHSGSPKKDIIHNSRLFRQKMKERKNLKGPVCRVPWELIGKWDWK